MGVSGEAGAVGVTALTLPTPIRGDFTSPKEVIVHADLTQRPDGHNRVRFTAFWLTDQEWVPDGVRGQVFHSDLDRFVADDAQRGRTVRVVDTKPTSTGGA